MPSKEAKSDAARKAGNMIPKRRKAKKKRMEYSAPKTTAEMRKRQSDVAAKRERTRNPAKAQVLDARNSAGKTVSKVQGYLKMMGMSKKNK